MLYQLSSGKTIYLTLDQYLDLTDQDIQNMVAGGVGGHPPSAFYDSSISRTKKKVKEEEEEEEEEPEEDSSIDYEPEVDERTHGGTEEELLDDFPDVPEDMQE